MENVIEKIHADFCFDLFEQVRKANDFSYLEKYRPSGVSQEEFVDQVEYYRTFYPSNNFVTEKQIAEICYRYKLVLGPFINFTGIIPIKNRVELKTFQLRPVDQVLNDSSLPGRIYASIVNGSGKFCSADLSPSTLKIRSGFVPGDMEKPFDLLPVGDSFVLVSADNDGEIYRLFLKIDFFGSEWLVDLGLVSTEEGSVWVRWRNNIREVPFGKSFAIANDFEVELSLWTDFISRINAVNLSSNVCPLVVAPGTMFERFRGAVEVSGYRLRFKPGTNPVDRSVFSHVDDPIILQPVKYGYLVVTKWGKESIIGEIQNAKTN